MASEKTKVYGQNMGIQNSQQMVGLMQGDEARTQNLNNTNMSTRDKAINDIKTRLNSLKNNMNIDISTANSAYNTGMQEANATANLNASTNLFNFQNEDYQNEVKHNYAIEELYTANELDNKKIELMFQNDIKKMSMANGFDLQKISIEQGNAMSRIYAQANAQVKAESDAFAISMQRKAQSLGLDPNASPFDIATAEDKKAYQDKVAGIRADLITKAEIAMDFPEGADMNIYPLKPYSNSYMGLGSDDNDTMPSFKTDPVGTIWNYFDNQSTKKRK